MKIVATFANFTYDADVIELACAWDEYSMDANYEGWEKDKKKTLDAYGDDLLHHVDVEIEVPMASVYAHFQNVSVDASSVEVQA
jgi:hypothetical protein